MNPNLLFSGKQQTMVQTNFKLEREHQDEMPYSIDSQIDVVVQNIQIYLSLLISNIATIEQIEQLKKSLITQLEFINSDFAHTQKINRFINEIGNKYNDIQQHINLKQYAGYQKAYQFGQVIKDLMTLRADTESEQEFENLNKMITGFLKEMEIILLQDNYTISRLQKYQIVDNNLQKSCSSNDKQVQQVVAPGHFWKKQQITFRHWQPGNVFQWVEPPLHRIYLSQVTKVYHDVVPFKIKFVCLNSLDQPKIQYKNYFDQNIDPEKAVIHYCVPESKKLITYRVDDVCKLLTIQKQFATERELSINWQFTQNCKTVITPEGRIFGINCRTDESKIDSSLYQITTQKASNRGKIPEPKRNSSIVYCNKAIYIIGGNNDSQKCSSRNFKYSLRDKKWHEAANSCVALRSSTVCSFRDRYIVKIGGLNEFDYINKVIQIYDTTTDKWSIVRANPKNVLQQVQILQDSLAVQISQDQVYVFAGKNSNGFRHDTGLVFHFMEIRQKIKAPAKVSGQLWNVSIGKKNILSFFGILNQSNVVLYGNCIYPMRASTNKLQRI